MTTIPLPPPMSDKDREAVFLSLPDMLDGFMKTWGWLHFAKGIEAARDAQWQAYATAARADLEAEVKRLKQDAEELQFLTGDLLYWTERAVSKGNANCDIEAAWERYEEWMKASAALRSNP